MEPLAQAVLDARAAHDETTLAELYDPDLMPPNLRRAHHTLDRAVDRLYRRQRFTSERERLEYLFALYERMQAPLTAKTLIRPGRSHAGLDARAAERDVGSTAAGASEGRDTRGRPACDSTRGRRGANRSWHVQNPTGDWPRPPAGGPRSLARPARRRPPAGGISRRPGQSDDAARATDPEPTRCRQHLDGLTTRGRRCSFRLRTSLMAAFSSVSSVYIRFSSCSFSDSGRISPRPRSAARSLRRPAG